MKKIISIALIFVMSLQCLYQLGVITYFHMNRDYIAEVLCINKEKPIAMCYGQCFLEKNLELTDDANDDKGALPVGKQRIDFPVFIVSECLHSFREPLKVEQGDSHYMTGTSSEHHPAPFRPPAQIS